ncbi:transposase [Cupriavidus necator]|uniref:transposase n=1 Tax=Cupriavidus necator TaxID=106590 RepID=UPI001D00F951|nr:transposase [Cupriavidus necator]
MSGGRSTWGGSRQVTDWLTLGGVWGLVNPRRRRTPAATCPCCGHVSADNRRTQERFACVNCGFEANADLVGAINVAGRTGGRCDVAKDRREPGAG